MDEYFITIFSIQQIPNQNIMIFKSLNQEKTDLKESEDSIILYTYKTKIKIYRGSTVAIYGATISPHILF